MSSISNKFKLEAKSLEPQVARFVSNTKHTNLHIIPEDSNVYSVIGTQSFSNNEAFIAMSSNGVVSKIAAFDDCNINFFRDTIVHGNLIIDGYVMTLGLDVALSANELFSSNQNNFMNVGSNVIVQKYTSLIDSRILLSSNQIISNLNALYSNLYDEAYSILSSNNSFTEAIRLADNYSEEKFNMRFSSKTADNILSGSSNRFIVNNVYNNRLIVKADLYASNLHSMSNINVQNSITAQKFYGDGTNITNIIAGDGTTNSISEGSNQYFKYAYVGAILNQSNQLTSNYINTLYSNLEIYRLGDLSAASNQVANISDTMLILCSNQDLNLSNYVNIDLKDIKLFLKESNSNIHNHLTYYDVFSSNHANYTYNIIPVLRDTSNAFAVKVSGKNNDLAVYIQMTSNQLYIKHNHLYNTIYNSLLASSNEVLQDIRMDIQNISNITTNVMGYSNILEDKIKIDLIRTYDYQNIASNVTVSKLNTVLYDFLLLTSNNVINYRRQKELNLIEYQHITSNNIYDDLETSILVASNMSQEKENDVLSMIRMSSNSLLSTNKGLTDAMVMNSNEYLLYSSASNVKLVSSIMNTSNNIMNKLVADNANMVTFSENSIVHNNTLLTKKIVDLTCDDIAEGVQALYYDQQIFDVLFNTLDFNQIANGTSNKYIVNDVYEDDLNVLGTVYTSNLTVNGQLNLINTTVYRTGAYSISSSNNVDLQVTHNNLNDIIILHNKNNEVVFIVKNTGKVGIKKSNPDYEIDVNGVISGVKLIGDASKITNVNLNDKSTAELAEGSNLYFTSSRVALLIDFSNLNVSNFITNTSNNLINNLTIFSSQSNYIDSEFKNILTYLSDSSIGVSNYVYAASNHISLYIAQNDLNLSNYVINIDNKLSATVLNNVNYNSNYMLSTSNKLVNDLYKIDKNQSNYIANSFQTINTYLISRHTDSSNFVNNSSNTLIGNIVNYSLPARQSNLMLNVSNYIYITSSDINTGLSNYTGGVSNIIIEQLRSTKLSEYLQKTSNSLAEYAYNGLETLNATTNIYTITDVYSAEKILHVNFNNSNIIAGFTNTNLRLYNNGLYTSLYPSYVNEYFGWYDTDNKYVFNSTSNLYVINKNDSDAQNVLNKMNEGFVVHFIFKTIYTQNTPIYYIGNYMKGYINIKILNGNLCVSLDDISIVVKSIIIPNQWYMVDIICNVYNNTIYFRIYLNNVLQSLSLNGIAAYNNQLLYSGGQNSMIMLGSSNLLDTFEDMTAHKSGFVYTNTYFSSNSYISAEVPAILASTAYDSSSFSNLLAISQFDYQYSSNVSGTPGSFYDNADSRLIIGNRDVEIIDQVFTEVSANVKLNSGYYLFGLDINNERNCEMILGQRQTVAKYFSSNVSSLYPFYIPMGVYKLRLRILRDKEYRNQNYFIGRCVRYDSWGGEYYTLNDDENIMYTVLVNAVKNSMIGLNELYVKSPVVSVNSTSNIQVYNYDQRIMLAVGNNISGQLGIGNNTNYNILQQVFDNISFVRDVKEIACSDDFTLMLKDNGTVFACGNNSYGQLGLGNVTNYNFMQQVKGVGGVGYIQGISKIATGTRHILLINNNNLVYGCGENAYGQLGLGNNVNSYNTLQLLNINNVIEVAGGSNYSLFLKQDGNVKSVYVCGNNELGQLGLGDLTNYNTIQLMPGIQNANPIQVACRSLSSYILMSDGNVYACGNNSYGQLGVGNIINYNVLQQMKGVGGTGYISNIKQISAGSLFVLLLNNTGYAFGCGENQTGQLGVGNNTNYNVLQQVKGENGSGYISAISYVSAGMSHSLFLKDNGSVYSCGYNNYGQLGLGNNTNYNVLKLVKGSGVVKISAGNHSALIENKANSVNVVRYRHEADVIGNIYNSSNILGIQDFKILSNPIVIGSDYSVSNILYYGKESSNFSFTNKLRTNRWDETAGYDLLSDADKFIYYNQGNVAIGNIEPRNASLEIQTGNALMSVKTNNSIWTNTGIITSSDERIKKNIVDINDDSALQQILAIEPKSYKYIHKDTGEVYGFIAQQVAGVIPNAIKLETDAIPNVYMNCVIENNVILDCRLPEYVREGNNIIIIYNNTKYVDKIVGIAGRQVTIENTSKIPNGLIFVYGSVISDYHILDKSYIYTLNVCALQEIHKRNIALKADLESLKMFDYAPAVEMLTSNIEFVNDRMSELTELHFAHENEADLFDNVKALTIFNQMLLNNVEMYEANADSIFENAQKELIVLQTENSNLCLKNKELVREYNNLNDSIRNYTNEIITIKSILQMNNIV